MNSTPELTPDCRRALADLSAFVDGELDADRVEAIRAHLAVCRACESFGGRFAELVTRFRRTLAAPEPLEADAAARLLERLEREA